MHRTRAIRALVLSLGGACTACTPSGQHATAEPPHDANTALAAAEARYLDLADAQAALEAIESGLFAAYDGRDHAAWLQAQQAAAADVRRDLAALPPHSLADAADRRAVDLMRGQVDSLAGSLGLAPSARCADAQRSDIEVGALSAALYACFEEHAQAIPFEGATLTRVAAFERLAQLEEPARRKQLFLAMQPLWAALNGANSPDSPYRRLVRASVAQPGWDSPVDQAARTIGIPPADVEGWLVRILEAWRAVDAGAPIEPWDYRHRQGAASRRLASCIGRDDVLPIVKRYYADLGADLDALGVVHDIDVRPGKAPIAYSWALRYGRTVDGRWRPTVPRVSSNLLAGGVGELAELIHEDGHAVQYAAIRARPAFEVGSDEDMLFWEAFADVATWSVDSPDWQRRYLRCQAAPGEGLRTRYGNVMLDVAWGLFDVRMLQDADRDPNAVWTDITSRYLNIVPHPELSWWAVRAQLVESPGYMVTYALGAALTADLRARTVAAIGPFDAGNPRWYGWLAQSLLGEGSARPPRELLAEFLGRAPSTDAIVSDIARASRD